MFQMNTNHHVYRKQKLQRHQLNLQNPNHFNNSRLQKYILTIVRNLMYNQSDGILLLPPLPSSSSPSSPESDHSDPFERPDVSPDHSDTSVSVDPDYSDNSVVEIDHPIIAKVPE